jgi:hypothetical protein
MTDMSAYQSNPGMYGVLPPLPTTYVAQVACGAALGGSALGLGGELLSVGKFGRDVD